MARATAKQRMIASEQQTRRLKEAVRKIETRQKILLGTLLLQHMQRDPAVMQQWLNELDNWLSRQYDRRAFADYGIGGIKGLYCRPTFQHVPQPPGWSLGFDLKEAAGGDEVDSDDALSSIEQMLRKSSQ